MSNKFLNSNISLLFLIFILCIIVFFPITKTGFTTTDDIYTELFPTVFNAASDQGRVGFLLLGCIAKIPYLIDSEAYFQICRIGSIIFTIVLFSACIYYLLDSFAIAVLSAVFFISFVQNSWDHNPITSYPVTFQFILQSLFLSFIFFKRSVLTENLRLGIASAFFYLLALSYETVRVYFPFFLLIQLQGHNSKNKIANAIRVRGIIREIFPIIGAIFVYISSYVCWRYLHPSEYPGNIIHLNNLVDFVKTVFQYSISSMPGYYYFKGGAYRIAYGFGQVFSFSHFLDQMRVEWMVKACVVFWTIRVILQRAADENLNKKKLFYAILSCIAAIFLPNMLLGATAKYQEWVLLHGSTGYTTTYFSFFGTVTVLALLSTYILKCIPHHRVRTCLVLIFAIGASYVSLVTDYHNFFVVQDQKMTHMKWKVMDRFLESPTFHSIPSGSTVYSPTLYEGRGIVGIYPHYWTSYIQKKTGKAIQMLSELPENGLKNREDVYFLKFQQEPHTENHTLIFGKIEKITLLNMGVPNGYSAAVFSYSVNKILNLIGFTLCEESEDVNILANGIALRKWGETFAGKIDLRREKTDFPEISINSNSLMSLNDFIINYHKNTKFSQNISFLEGWSFDEVKFRWSIAKTAYIGIISPNKSPQYGFMEFYLYSLKARAVDIFFNSRLVKKVILYPNRVSHVMLNELFFNACGDISTLKFETDVAPEHPPNNDPRRLSFSVGGLRFGFHKEKAWHSGTTK